MAHHVWKPMAAGCCIALALLGIGTRASDHIDGVPSLERHEELDLTDLYVFPAADRPGWLAIILNLYPGAADDAGFSPHVFYRIHLRPASIPEPGSGRRVSVSERDALVIECAVAGVEHGRTSQNGKVACEAHRTKRGAKPVATATAPLSRVSDESSGPMRIFAGARADPFFISKDHFEAVTKRADDGFEVSPSGSVENILARINVLSLVLEIDMAVLFPDRRPDRADDPYAVAATSFARTDSGPKQLDRIGRPEINNLSLHPPTEDAARLKAAYNRRPAFSELPPAQARPFADRLTDNIGAYDSSDGTRDWSEADLADLVGLLLEDFQLIDLSKPCPSADGYFSIERAILQDRPHTACGGRRLRDDVVRTLYALYIGGLNADPADFETGVSAPYQGTDKGLRPGFPYLAEPHSTGLFDINVIRFLLNHVSKRNQDSP
jgi:hypothetical protein